MSSSLHYTATVTAKQLGDFLFAINNSFLPKLSDRIDLKEYTQKLMRNASVFATVDKASNEIVAAILVYANNFESKEAYIPIVGTIASHRGQGLIKSLFDKVEASLREQSFQFISLETWLGGDALNYYVKNGYFVVDVIADRSGGANSVKLKKDLRVSTEAFDFYPTPLEMNKKLCEDLGIELYIKRDDIFGVAGGGSKGRKLKYILKKAESQNCNAIVTTGSNQSNHLRAAALMASALGMQSAMVIHDEKPGDLYQGNLKLLSLAASKLTFVKKEEVKKAMDGEIVKFIRDGYRPFYIWGGGHSLEGAWAYYQAVYELKEQLAGVEPDYLIVASGTGTTQAGIEVGVRKLFPKCKVLGISVARDRERGIKAVVESANDLISKAALDIDGFNMVEFDDTKMGSGYEDTYPELLHEIRKAMYKYGIVLDPTYSGKAFFGMTEYIKKGRIPPNSKVVFWHTGGLLNLLNFKEIS